MKGQVRLQKSEIARFEVEASEQSDGLGRTGESLKIAVHAVHLPGDIKSREHDESRPLRCRSSGRSACVDRRPGGAGKLCQRRRFNASDYII